MKGFFFVIDCVNKWVGQIMAFLVLVIIAITMLEVIARFAFNSPTIWVQETSGQLFGISMILGGGYALLNKAHIRVDILWARFSRRKQAMFDLVTFGFAALFLGMLLWQSCKVAASSIQILEHSPTFFNPPIYPFKTCLAIGASLLCLQIVAKILRDSYLVFTGHEYV